MTKAGAIGRGRGRGLGLAVGAVALLGGAVLWWGAGRSAVAPLETRTDERGETFAVPGHEPRRVEPHGGAIALVPGETVRLRRSALQAGKSVSLQLAVPATAARASALEVAVVSAEGPARSARASVAPGAPATARVEIPAAWLQSPGRHLVQVKLPEKASFPHRRYAILVD